MQIQKHVDTNLIFRLMEQISHYTYLKYFCSAMDFFLQMNENAFVTRAKNASKQKNVDIAKERKIKQLL